MAATSTTASNSKMEHTSFQNLHMQQQAGGGCMRMSLQALFPVSFVSPQI